MVSVCLFVVMVFWPTILLFARHLGFTGIIMRQVKKCPSISPLISPVFCFIYWVILDKKKLRLEILDVSLGEHDLFLVDGML